MKKNKAVLFCITFFLLIFSVTANAYEIESISGDGTEFEAKLLLYDEAFEPDDITVQIQGENANVTDFTEKTCSVHWIIMVDTSKSVNEAYFKSSIAQIKNIYENLSENDKLTLYSFGTVITPVITDDTPSETAAEKIDAVLCDSQETVFYDAVKKMTEEISLSTSDLIIPLFFTDGVDTQSSVSMNEAADEMVNTGIPFYAFYSDNISAEKSSALSEFIKTSGGQAFSYTPDDLEPQLNFLHKTKRVTLKLKTDNPVPSAENAIFTVSVGDTKAEKEFRLVSTEITTEAQPTEETTTGTADEQDSGSGFPIYIIAAAVIIAAGVAAFIIVKKKKSDADDKPEIKTSLAGKADTHTDTAEESSPEAQEATDKKSAKAEKNKKKEAQQFKFYFVDKK